YGYRHQAGAKFRSSLHAPLLDARINSAVRVYSQRRCESCSHFTSKTRAMMVSKVPAGIHMISPPICWSSNALMFHAGAVKKEGEYQARLENVSRAPRTLV